MSNFTITFASLLNALFSISILTIVEEYSYLMTLQLLFRQAVLHHIITALVDMVGVEPTSRGGFMPAFHNATYP